MSETNTAPTTFTTPLGKSIRVVMVEGEPWFVARDVCESIDRAWAGSTLGALDASEKGRRKLSTPNGGAQSFTIISESGLYKLVLRAHPHVNPAAKVFQNWVTKEVLPAIRKDGATEQHYPG